MGRSQIEIGSPLEPPHHLSRTRLAFVLDVIAFAAVVLIAIYIAEHGHRQHHYAHDLYQGWTQYPRSRGTCPHSNSTNGLKLHTRMKCMQQQYLCQCNHTIDERHIAQLLLLSLVQLALLRKLHTLLKVDCLEGTTLHRAFTHERVKCVAPRKTIRCKINENRGFFVFFVQPVTLGKRSIFEELSYYFVRQLD